MAIHENLTRIPKPRLREVGWSKAAEMAKLSNAGSLVCNCMASPVQSVRRGILSPPGLSAYTMGRVSIPSPQASTSAEPEMKPEARCFSLSSKYCAMESIVASSGVEARQPMHFEIFSTEGTRRCMSSNPSS
jgi:hypothetical protein